MKRIILLFFLIFSFSFSKTVYVKGYYRKNGTYVQPHTRSFPKSSGKKSSYNYSNYSNYSKETYNHKNHIQENKRVI